jgi:hypothetical protein
VVNGFIHEEAAARLIRHLNEVVESCRRQRRGLTLERERLRLGRELRQAKARLQLRRAFRQEVEAVSRPLIESARAG